MNPEKTRSVYQEIEWSLKLPYDHPQTPQMRYRKGSVCTTLDTALKDHLSSFEDGDAWRFLLAGCLALLYRYCGQSGILVRLYLFTPNGNIVNNRALFIDTQGSQKFSELQDELQHQVFTNTSEIHQRTQVTITIFTGGEMVSSSGKDHQLDGTGSAGSTDLELTIKHHSRDSELKVDYNANLFEDDTIVRLKSHLVNLWRDAAQNNDSTLAALEIFQTPEKEWLEQACRGTTTTFPVFRLDADIQQHAHNFPDKLAVTGSNGDLSYRELNNRANQLAHELIRRGAGAESRIMVALDPCLEIAVVLLAILKTGATYVPLNPAYPAYRINIIVEDTQPQLAIINKHLSSELDLGEVPKLLLEDFSETGPQEYSDPNVVFDQQQTAYIYYTSGTTGKPKGSMGSYANLCHYIRVAQDKYGFSASEIMPAMASYTFSISMFELLSPLVAGGTLRILQRSEVLDASFMIQTLQEVTFIHAGPSLLKSLVKYIQKHISDYTVFKSLRHLSSGGDMVPPDLLQNLREIFPQVELFVIYGCSEIGCMGCTYFYHPDKPITKTLVGKPFDNVVLRLLDEDGNQVPVGVTGEVCFGGGGVAKGYLNRLALTDKKFYENSGTRFYRTGDMGKLNSQGDLELLGRRDFQVHVRGMRVELGEVEYHLRQAPGVRDAVVISRKHGAQQNVLVGYYVADASVEVTTEQLRAYMARHLPDYMTITFYLQLEALPLNVNMKVDRKALLSTDLVVASSNKEPVTTSELELAAIWSTLLHQEQIGLDDNFLALGGDSLLAMELIYVVEKKMGVKLDGMDILRESLQVLAGICDRELGRASTRLEDVDKGGTILTNEVHPLESFFFGTNNELYGLFHPASSPQRSTAVLVCPPVGEYKRCYFLLKTISDMLASQGMPVLRFDYFGTSDSLGDNIEGSIERWQSDIVQAKEELLARTNCQHVTVFSVRLGALLALKALGQSDVRRWVLWDPIVNGSRHYAAQKKMHKQKIWRAKVLRQLARPRTISGAEELVGFTYSHRTVSALKNLVLEEGDIKGDINVHQVVTHGISVDDKTGAWRDLLGKDSVEHMEVKCAWYELANLNKAITDRHLYSRLLEIINIDQ